MTYDLEYNEVDCSWEELILLMPITWLIVVVDLFAPFVHIFDDIGSRFAIPSKSLLPTDPTIAATDNQAAPVLSFSHEEYASHKVTKKIKLLNY